MGYRGGNKFKEQKGFGVNRIWRQTIWLYALDVSGWWSQFMSQGTEEEEHTWRLDGNDAMYATILILQMK